MHFTARLVIELQVHAILNMGCTSLFRNRSVVVHMVSTCSAHGCELKFCLVCIIIMFFEHFNRSDHSTIEILFRANNHLHVNIMHQSFVSSAPLGPGIPGT